MSSKGVFDLTFVSLRERSKSLNILAVILVVFIIANLVFIWLNSAKVATSSNKQSTKLAETIVKKTTKNYDKLPKSEQQKKISSTNNKIRSFAHFAEFVPLGFFVFFLMLNLFYDKGRYKLLLKCILLSLIVCMLSALSDEIHQIFIKGRAFEVKDLLVDSCGSLLGILFGTFVCYVKTLIQNKKCTL